MGADMLTATLATRTGRKPHFGAGRTAVEEAETVVLYDFDAMCDVPTVFPSADYDELVDDENQLRPGAARRIALKIIDDLERTLNSREVNMIIVGGYNLYISGGLSSGDSPTDAAEAIWNADKLPEDVLDAMGFVPDFSQPPADSIA